MMQVAILQYPSDIAIEADCFVSILTSKPIDCLFALSCGSTHEIVAFCRGLTLTCTVSQIVVASHEYFVTEGSRLRK
eukprot:1767119-Pleurochrysis_carterae.AAC.1